MGKKDYTKYNRQPAVTEEAIKEIETIEEVMEERIEEAPVYEHGFVSGCIRLNIRKDPTIKSEVVCVVEGDTELVITLNESTDDFYKVSTAAGIDGFCMKQYVTIN